MRHMKVVIIAVMFLVANTAMAGKTLYENATIKSVDVENNTFTVELDSTGATKTYSFPETINFIDDGVTLVDKSAFKPGQSVKLKLESETPKFNNPGTRTSKEYSLKGMIVD